MAQTKDAPAANNAALFNPGIISLPNRSYGATAPQEPPPRQVSRAGRPSQAVSSSALSEPSLFLSAALKRGSAEPFHAAWVT